MPKYVYLSRCSLLVAAFMSLCLLSHQISYAESRVFSGKAISVTKDKKCQKTPDNIEILLEIDGEPEVATSGWFYGKETNSAELRRTSPMNFEIIYPIDTYFKLPPAHMEILSSGDGYRAVIKDHIPERFDSPETVCFFEKMEISLKPINEPADSIKSRAKELFSLELISHESADLILNKKEFLAGEANGRKALAISERIHGKLSKEALDASMMIAVALMELNRFDEALGELKPYRKSVLSDEDFETYKEKIQSRKKEYQEEQEEQLRSGSGGKSNIQN